MKTTLLEWFRPSPRPSSQAISLLAERDPLLGTDSSTANGRTIRSTVAADFFHKGTTIHCMCLVERQQDTRLRLRISSEMGTTSLFGLMKDVRGQVEIESQLVPFRVLGVRLPLVDIATSPQHAQPARRQWLRTPASFAVRLRRHGSQGLWISGQGMDLSAGGCSFLLAFPHVPHPQTRYEVEMLLTLPQSGEIRPLFNGEVQWVKEALQRRIAVGVEIRHPGQRKALALAVTEIQQALTRRPEDYLPR
jgi:hypothetical protein